MLVMLSAKDKSRRPERKQKHRRNFKNWQERQKKELGVQPNGRGAVFKILKGFGSNPNIPTMRNLSKVFWKSSISKKCCLLEDSAFFIGPVAQKLEQDPYKVLVVGALPTGAIFRSRSSIGQSNAFLKRRLSDRARPGAFKLFSHPSKGWTLLKDWGKSFSHSVSFFVSIL